ncbi:hypothetical protein CRG98_021202 [Punica granatum]|uniref:Integrase catalytic domain-containing protein n=1 Tax=Punica granatum TaxID=22663 RepID=A0A2I0JQ10_PUNGR|nr:hypothetical protein CRG98_021202 [Punica granatum]
MPGLDPSIVEHFLPLDTEKFQPKRQQLRRQRASLLLRMKEEVVKQINAGFLEVCNYSEWVANIVPVEKKDGRVRLRLNPAKCTFGAQSGKLLGFVVSERGIEVDPDKVKAIKELPPPSMVREVRGFLGRLNYIARFIANLMDKCQPLFRLLRKNAAMECMLGQQDESTRTERAIYYLSKKFTEGESNYPEIEKMCCALVWVMQRLRQYTIYHTVRLLSKADPLRYLLDSPSSMKNNAKWRCQLTEYDIEYVPRTSVKGQAIADHLAEFPINDDTPINTDFPDEGILQVDEEKEEPTWKMYFDGAVNSVGSGVGAVLISPDGHHYPVAAKTKDAKLVPYHEYLEELAKSFEKISFTYTPRAKNQFADALATLASMASISEGNIIEPLEIEVAKGPAHCNTIEASEEKPWYEDIRNLLQTGQYPLFADRRDRKTLRRLAIHYFLSGEILYHRSFDSMLLRCIDEHESRRLIEEVHGGNCGPHMNGLMLAKKIMRLGYYWSTVETDCVKHVRHCHRCQVYADQIKAPPNELRPMTALWPFSMWGIDVIGPINPKASNGHMFILVAIDYFTKWIEAITLASVTAKAVARFLRRDVIARYGVPATIIMDNAKNLNNKAFSFLHTGAIWNPKGCSPPTDSCLPHVTGRALEAPETVEGCVTPPKPTMFKEGQSIGDHYQPLRMRRSRPKRQASHITQRFAPIPNSKFLFGSIPV